ncbi:hypothetical protein DV736_g4207, partial [Chaetothyriales sp. CBS 134916]
MTLLSTAFLPRARFIQSMFYSILFVCIAAALGLLAIQCAVSARNSTVSQSAAAPGSSGGQEAIVYSASASATSGVWLFILIYLVNIVRAYRSQLSVPSIQYMIFIIIVAVYAPLFPSMAIGMEFIRRLLIVFFTGFAFAVGVNLFVFPITSRVIVNKQIAGMLGLISRALKAHEDYMSAIHNPQRPTNDINGKASKDGDVLATKAKALKDNISAIGALLSKLRPEIKYAKREIGYGKIGPKEYSEILVELVHIILPVIGTSTLMSITQSVGQKREKLSEKVESEEILQTVRCLQAEEWKEVISMSKEAYANLQASLLQGLTHIGLVLGVFPKPKKSGRGDIEKNGGGPPLPGDKEFSKSLKATLDAFHEHRETAILRWCERTGINLPKTFWDKPHVPFSLKDNPNVAESARKAHRQQQLYILLYMEYLVYSIGQSILETVNYVDGKYADGTFAKNRLILPGLHRWQKLFLGVLSEDDSYNTLADGDSTGANVWIGDSLNSSKKDPEHLPPTTFFQKATNPLRMIPHVLGGYQSAFAFRTAVATLSIGILAYLHQTVSIFNKQRGMWALMMVCLSMDSHAGRGIFGFILRTLGTAVAMVASIVIWYIGDHHAAAIIPVFFIYLLGCMWYLLKNPSMAMATMISMVTAVLIIGYELQDQKLGREATVANGQPFYKIYILAPYRLATVVIGLGTAAFWTYFPYPVTTHSTLRKELSKTLFLLGNYYSCANTTIYARLRSGSLAAEKVRGKPLFKLAKARHKVFGKVVTMLTSLRENSEYSKWEPTFGGRFPLETYTELIDSAQHILNYTSLMVYCSAAFTSDTEKEGSKGGVGGIGDIGGIVTGGLRPVSHSLTSRLCLLAASLSNKQPLPPYLHMPRAFNLAVHMARVDPEILSVHHIREPCYPAFAVLEVASTLVQDEVEKISGLVRQLVGEVDFSFHVISTTDEAQGQRHGRVGGKDSEVSTLLGDDGKANKQD